jgi:hypothetical protein
MKAGSDTHLIVLKCMIRLPALFFGGCMVCAGLIPSNDSPSFEARVPVPSSADDAHSPLRDVRLTGIVIGPDLRIAIFAVSGTNPLVLSEGETLKDWRLDRISPGKVLLSGPSGTIKLEPNLDANLVRPTPPVAVGPSELEPSVPPVAELAGAPGPSTAITPIPVDNLSAAIPVEAQGYSYNFPENYAWYEQDYPSYNYYPYPFFAYAVPIEFAFPFGFFHHHVIHHGAFHGAAFHSGGFHGGRHR